MKFILVKRSSHQYLRCVRCSEKLTLDVLNEDKEIDEGFLICNNCLILFPIIQGIPILWDDFEEYIRNRPALGGKFVQSVKTDNMKSFLQKKLSNPKKSQEDKSKMEQKWVRIYQNSNKSKFYTVIRSFLKKLKTQNIVLEHGCSIGIISNYLSKNNQLVFGIDRSFHAIKIAKKNQKKNCDYFVAISESHPFGNQKFDLVICLNMLELLEPKNLLQIISNQIKKGTLVLSDPYDFDRGINTVKNPIDAKQLRSILKELNFTILKSTKNPSYISWNLSINSRAVLQYKVDLVIAKK